MPATDRRLYQVAVRPNPDVQGNMKVLLSADATRYRDFPGSLFDLAVFATPELFGDQLIRSTGAAKHRSALVHDDNGCAPQASIVGYDC
jgi:hypothetical protein